MQTQELRQHMIIHLELVYAAIVDRLQHISALPIAVTVSVLLWQAPTAIAAVAVLHIVKYPLLDISNKALLAYRMEENFIAERWYIKSSMVDSRPELLGNQYSLNERDVLITLWLSLACEGNWMPDGYGTQHVECMVLLILIDGFTI